MITVARTNGWIARYIFLTTVLPVVLVVVDTTFVVAVPPHSQSDANFERTVGDVMNRAKLHTVGRVN